MDIVMETILIVLLIAHSQCIDGVSRLHTPLLSPEGEKNK